MRPKNGEENLHLNLSKNLFDPIEKWCQTFRKNGRNEKIIDGISNIYISKATK